MTVFNKPNVKGPRFGRKAHSLVSPKNDTFFKAFKKKHPEYSNLDSNIFKKIIHHHCKLLAKRIAETRDGVELGEQICIIFLGAVRLKPGSKVINFAKSLIYGKKITGHNWNEDGMIAKIYMSTYMPKYKIEGRDLWSFTACRDLKRSCSKNFKENWENYIILDHTKNINKEYKKDVFRNIIKAKEGYSKKHFNDFDI